MQIPETKYARSGNLRLAYQQYGEGPPLLIVQGLVSNAEVQWEHEFNLRILDLLSRHMHVASFDKRGIGLSDRPEEMPTLEERIGDIAAVLDTMGWDRASLFGVSEGGLMAQLFAASHPDRVDKLVLHNTMSPARHVTRRRQLADGLRQEPASADVVAYWGQLISEWPDNADMFVDQFMPSQAGNERFVRWVGRLQRLSASPRDFRRQAKSVFALDAGDAAERITAPTLIMQVAGDRIVHASHGRMLAELIPKSRYVEVVGDDHFSWALPNWRDISDPLIEFITGSAVNPVASRRFATVMFTDIVDSTRQASAMGDAKWLAVLDAHDRLVRRLVDRHGGRLVKSTGDGLLATFDVPSQGVECGKTMMRDIQELGVTIRAGLHAGEIEVHDDLDISGIAVNLAARVEQAAGGGELFASSTVRDMMLGGSVTFADCGLRELKGIEGSWRLFRVS